MFRCMYVCVFWCVLVCRCPRGWCPASNKGFWGAKWRGGQSDRGLARPRGAVHREPGFVSQCVCVTQKVLTVCSIHISKLNMCMFFVTHAQFVYARSKPDLGWCHVQLLCGWQTVSAPQHGALWSACQPDRQVNDTNESQPSLPLGARHWVTASKQPKRAYLNLKVISLTLSLSRPSLFLRLLGLSFLFLSLALSLASSASFQKSLFLSFFLALWVFSASTEGLCLFSLSLLLPSLSPFHSICHCLVLFSITVSPSLKEQLDCLSVLSLKSKRGWKVFLNGVDLGPGLSGGLCECGCLRGRERDRGGIPQLLILGINPPLLSSFSSSSFCSTWSCSTQIRSCLGKSFIITFWKHHTAGLPWRSVGFRKSSSAYLHPYPQDIHHPRHAPLFPSEPQQAHPSAFQPGTLPEAHTPNWPRSHRPIARAFAPVDPPHPLTHCPTLPLSYFFFGPPPPPTLDFEP